ncbi:type II toxin-antitoxin system VapC family toxin [Aurantimonas coralicida]|uniref:type II toxin-antitoxin system VapC family toxin n=1 Tax=Aurantimonas coralicida TaxID=182270 RepID=UPI001E4F34B6|nr:PIN domain-containing protein [Aurantimonas coralicida]MCD1642165.1 PIN domain-containing protein [Aurantimonas coralicida]
MSEAGRERFYLDSNATIAIVERQSAFTPALELFLKAVDAGEIRVFSSGIALAECLVKPIRDGDQVRLGALLRFFKDERTLPLVPADRGIFVRAAELRALDYLQSPDAIHVACAIRAGCGVFLSADRRLRMPDTMRRIAFDNLQFGPE